MCVNSVSKEYNIVNFISNSILFLSCHKQNLTINAVKIHPLSDIFTIMNEKQPNIDGRSFFSLPPPIKQQQNQIVTGSNVLVFPHISPVKKKSTKAYLIWAQFHRAAKHKNLFSMKFLP